MANITRTNDFYKKKELTLDESQFLRFSFRFKSYFLIQTY